MKSYAALSFNIKDDNNVTQHYDVFLYSINDSSIFASTQVVQHPMVTGDKVADHMYREPDSISLSGTVSQYKSSAVVNENVFTLQSFEDLFERVKNEGVVCSLVRMSVDDSGTASPKFKIRNNLVLKSINLTERNNTLDFSFSFEQVLFSETIEYDVTVDDNNMPNVQYPEMKNFSESLFDKSKAVEAIVTYLKEEGFITEEFWNKFFNWQSSKEFYAGAIIAGAGVGISVTTYIAVGTSIGAVAGLIGTVAGLAVGLVVYSVCKLIQIGDKARKYKTKPFEKWNDKEKTRFEEFLKSLSNEFDAFNTAIKVYQLTSDDDQQICLSIGDTYYTFVFTTNNVNKNKSLSIKNIDEKDVKIVSDLRSCPTDLSEFKANTSLVTANNNYSFVAYLGDDTDSQKDKLSNYAIVISTIEPSKIMDAVIQIVKDNIYRT